MTRHAQALMGALIACNLGNGIRWLRCPCCPRYQRPEHRQRRQVLNRTMVEEHY
jgi:hypothetical protein